MKLIKSIAKSIVAYYWLVLILVAALSIPLFYFSSKLYFYNDIEIYFEDDNKELADYKKFQERYGNEQLVVAVFKDENLFSVENIQLIRQMSGALKRISGVQQVYSLTEAKEVFEDSESIDYKEIIPTGAVTAEQLQKVRKKVMANEAIRDNLLSKDGTTTAVVIELKALDRIEKRKTLGMIVTASGKIGDGRIKLHYTGIPFIEAELTRLSERDLVLFIPILLLIIFVVTVFLLKSVSLAILSQVNLLITTVWTVGFFVVCGESFNIVVVTMTAILLAISIADSIHILTQYKKDLYKHGYDSIKAIRSTLTHIWLPCFLTSVTTAAGFLSFVTGSIRPVTILGIFTSVGVLFAFALSVTFMPATLILFRKRNREMGMEKDDYSDEGGQETGKGLLSRALMATGRFATGYRKAIIVVFVVLLVFGITGITRLTFESDSMRYLPNSNSFKSDWMFIEKNLGGSNPFVLLLQANGDVNFAQPEALKLLDKVQRDITASVEKITTAASITDYLKECSRVVKGDAWYRVPSSQEEIEEYYETAEVELLDRFLGPGKKEARITFRTLGGTNEEAVAINNHVRDYMKQNLGTSFDYKITGLTKLYVTLGKNLKESQIKSFVVAFIIIFIMMLYICRGVTLALLSMIPNLFPVAMILGYMGWANIPLTASTIMIASITLGIAVDDSIHFMVSFRRKIGAGYDTQTALMHVYGDVGKPVVITTLLLFLGFGVLTLGSILPTRFFGSLTAFSMLFALVGDLYVLPALILVLKPKVTPLVDKVLTECPPDAIPEGAAG
ncbi:MAG: MMPL family transporter [bacterium]|nr:MMPL family transporter [bacterium]